MFKKLILCMAVMLMLTGPPAVYAENDFPVTVTDSRGKKIIIESRPKRIVSLAPSLTEILSSLGLYGSLVGVTNRCNYPPEVKKLPKVGDVFIDREKVVSLRPDLVIAEAALSRGVVAPLEKLGLKVMLMNSSSLDGFEDTLLKIGKATGKSDVSKKLLEEFRSRLSGFEKASAKIPLEKRPGVLIEIQARPLFAAGESTFMSDIVFLAGGRNIIGRLPIGCGPVSLEKVIKDDPQVIILTDSTPGEFLSMPAWKNTSAAKNNRVFAINPDIFVRPTLRLPEALKQLKGWFYPRSKEAGR
ncbi:MAG: cobalamin-binding protein [Chloroflexi bacterium]|nr:cobalamin-binding protein [Chloroflexota bacterium]